MFYKGSFIIWKVAVILIREVHHHPFVPTPSGDFDLARCPDDPTINMHLYLKHLDKSVQIYKRSNIPFFIPILLHSTMTRPISDRTVRDIEALLRQGLGIKTIAKKLGISTSPVRRVCQTRLPDLPRSKGGRPSKLSEQDRRACVRLITRGDAETATQVTKQLGKNTGAVVSCKTVARALRQSGMRCTRKKRKPRLSPKNVKARLEFAHAHRDWTKADWKRVIWSDETKINRFGSDGRSRCWIHGGESIQDRHVQQTVKHGGGSIMVWGCMTYQGVGYLCKLCGKMDQQLYRSILEDELFKTIEYYKMKADKVVFQHDNDPKHRAKSVQEWLAKQPFEKLSWPSQSPDLNPIEHLWAYLKRQLNKYESPPKGMLELWERVEAEWNKINESVCINLIESMPRRMDAVIKAGGKWVDY